VKDLEIEEEEEGDDTDLGAILVRQAMQAGNKKLCYSQHHISSLSHQFNSRHYSNKYYTCFSLFLFCVLYAAALIDVPDKTCNLI
jgi:hypothetical protein